MKINLNFSTAKTRSKGFTIVELLVSLALIIFIMSLVSTIFVLATKSFRDMKAAGDLSDQLRSATQIIRATLKADHFTNKVKMSDDNFWTPKNATGEIPPPYNSNQNKISSNFSWRSGYFRFQALKYGAPILDGNDFQSVPLAIYNNRTDHFLSMTVLQDGMAPSNVFTKLFPPSTTPWNTPQQTYWDYSRFEDQANTTVIKRKSAEVALYLAAQDDFDPKVTGLLSNSNSLNLFTLNFKVWLLSDELDKNISDTIQNLTQNTTVKALEKYPDEPLSYYPKSNGTFGFNNLEQVSEAPTSELQPTPPNPKKSILDHRRTFQRFVDPSTREQSGFQFTKNPDYGSILLRNVISFQVTLIDDTGTPVPFGQQAVYPAPNVNQNGRPLTNQNDPNSGSNELTYFDTTISENFDQANGYTQLTNAQGVQKKITGIKITIRVYDPDNEITRQMTIIEPL